MKKNITIVILLAGALALSACSKQQFSINDGSGSLAKDDKHDFIVGGIRQTEVVDAATICSGADKVMSVEVEQTAMNAFLTVVSLGIYAPRQYRVTCGSASTLPSAGE